MRVRRVVLINYYFPPLVGIASARALARAEGLRSLGWDVSVVTVRDGHYHKVRDNSRFGFSVARTSSVELSRIARRVYAEVRRDEARTTASEGTINPVNTGRRGAQLRQIARDWIYVPDAQVGWIPFAVNAALRAIGSEPVVIVSSSVPYSAHLVGFFVAARRPQARWVAEFRDPWTTGATGTAAAHSPGRRRVDAAIEELIIRRTDHVIVTSRATRASMLAAHTHLTPERISVVMNGFTEPRYRRPVPAADEPCRIVYAGTVGDNANPGALLRAVDQVERDRPGSIRLRIIGPAEPWLASYSSPPPWLELGGVVDPEEARAEIVGASANVLLHLPPGPDLQISGKLFEYVGSRRPVLAVVRPESESAALLRAHADVRLVSSYDHAEIVGELARLVDEHAQGLLAGPRVPRALTEPLSCERQTAILHDVLHDLSRRN